MKIWTGTMIAVLLASAVRAGVTRDAEGWTVVTPSADSRIIYVSNSVGDDAYSGRAPDPMGGNAGPKKTISAGIALLRKANPVGYPDHLLFRRGDVWQGGFGAWVRSGRSPQEPMVIGAYGPDSLPRPRFESSGSWLSTTGGADVPAMRNLVFTSLHFRGTNPNGDQSCISWFMGAADVLFEDMEFERCGVEMQGEYYGQPGLEIEDVVFRRNQFLDSFVADAGGKREAMYLYRVSAVIEENVFDMCGWNPDVPEAVPNLYNHCIYWQYDGPPYANVVRNNIIMRAASNGIQMRSGGVVEGNVFVRNAIHGFVADDYDPAVTTPVENRVIGNVLSEGEDILPRTGHSGNVPRGWAFEVLGGRQPAWHVEMRDNITAHCLGSQCRNLNVTGNPDLDYANNVIWDWPGGSQPQSPGPFPDPDRTVATYNASLGRTGTFEAFAAEARQQSKTNWRTEYTAPAIIAYFRAGFGLGLDGLPPAKPKGLRRR